MPCDCLAAPPGRADTRLVQGARTALVTSTGAAVLVHCRTPAAGAVLWDGLATASRLPRTCLATVPCLTAWQ
eukprot:gene10756-biopygen151